MAIARESVKTWFINSADLDMRTLDVIGLKGGGVMVGFGGSDSIDAAAHTAMLNLSTDKLGAITTRLFTPTPSDSPVATIRDIDLTALSNGKAVATLHYFNANIAGESGLGLANLGYLGATPQGAARAVNPGQIADDTSDLFCTVALASGGYLTFFGEPGIKSFFDLNNGIRMTRFAADGTITAGPTKVIGETIVDTLANIENNPEDPSAVQMANGNIGLLYKESGAGGVSRIQFQELTIAGAKVGARVTIDNASGITPELIKLDGGKMVATWFEVGITGTGSIRAQMLTATGEKTGGSFAITDGGMGAFLNYKIVALAKGGFAVSWLDTQLGVHMAQLFTASGAANSNPFLLTDNAASYSGFDTVGGIVRQGDNLVTYISGINENVSSDTILQGQVFSTASAFGVTKTGTTTANRFDGGARDDRLNGAAGADRLNSFGGNDLLNGGTGNDTLNAGAGLDRLLGGDGNDVMTGGDGIDILTGGKGADSLTGGTGRDRLTGGLGADTMTGGGGADMFIFNTRFEGRDRITDFDAAEGDRLLVSIAGMGGPIIVSSGTDTSTAGAGFFFNTATKLLSYDPDGAGGQARQSIVVLAGVATFTGGDLQLF